MAATFLNVDLEIEGPEPLENPCCEFAERGAVRLYSGETKGGYLATLEMTGLLDDDPSAIITAFCNIIDGFNERARSDWSHAHSKTSDLGYEADSEPGAFHSDLKNDVVRRVGLLGADIRTTLYPRRSLEKK